ncbi:MAG: hypothetical protein RR603_02525 [Kurthia sp.]
MKTYLVNQLFGESFKVENVASIWTCDRGVHFCGENDKDLGFIPYNNLANYQLVGETVEATTVVPQLINEIDNTITITAHSIRSDDAVKVAAELSKEILNVWGDIGNRKCCK